MSRSCIKNIVKNQPTQRLLYNNRNVLLENRSNARNIILTYSTISSNSNIRLFGKISNRCHIFRPEIGWFKFSTNNEGTSQTKLENDVKENDETSCFSSEENNSSNINENLTNEEKMRNILKGVKKSITVELAATRLSTLLTTIPGDEVKPFIQRANDNLNNTHEIGRQTKPNVDVPEFFDQVESQMADSSDIRMSNDIERALIHILYALSSENIRKLSVPKMMSILKLLSLKVGLNENDSFAIKNILNGLIWKSREIPISELCAILSFSYKRKIESNNNKIAVLLFEESLKNAEKRWVEIVNAKEFTGIVHYYPNQVSEQFMRKLESRITDFIEKMDAADLAMILKILGAKKRRHMPLLKAISYHLIRKRNELDVKSLTDCLFALNQLNFKDFNLLEAIADSLNNKLTSTDSNELVTITEEQQIMLTRSIHTSLGQIKFLHTGLLDTLCTVLSSKIEDNPNNGQNLLKPKDFASFLMTTATLNYCPKDSDKLYEAVIQNLTLDTIKSTTEGKETAADVMWLNMVWSMTILNKAPHKCFASILNTEFFNKILYSHDHRNVQILLKLLNVNAAAKMDASYKGPRINVADDPLLQDVKSAQHADKSKFIEQAMDDFSKFASPPTYLIPNINTLMGFQIEGEVVFDKNGKALPISGLSILDEKSIKDDQKKKLPNGATRVAVMCIGYHDCLVDGTILSGATALNLRLLESKLKVFVIKHNYCSPRQKELERATVLDASLKKFLSKSK